MGNRVLATALASWAHDYGAVPALFRNLFMARPTSPTTCSRPASPAA